MRGVDQFEEGAANVGVRDDRLGADLPAVAQFDAAGFAVLDKDAFDRRLEMNSAAALLDRLDEHIRKPARAALRIEAALEVIAEDRDHLAAGEFLRAVAEIADQRIDHGDDLPVADMFGDEFVEGAVHPLEALRMLLGKCE